LSTKIVLSFVWNRDGIQISLKLCFKFMYASFEYEISANEKYRSL